MIEWVKLHRKMLDSPIWTNTNPNQKTIIITLLLLANHKENEWVWQGKVCKAKPGQFIISLESIAARAGKDITPRIVQSTIALLEKYKFLSNMSSKTGRLITITNWAFY